MIYSFLKRAQGMPFSYLSELLSSSQRPNFLVDIKKFPNTFGNAMIISIVVPEMIRVFLV